MKKHAGWVEVESAIGQGSTFRAYFPAVAEPAEKADAAAGADRARGGSETILLVEDDLHLRRMAVLSLRLLGYAVLEAADGEEALKVWNERRQRVHLLLTDLVMPKAMNGLDLAHRLKGEDAGLRVVVCSGYSNDVPNLHLLGEEAAFLAKPFKPATLAKVIRECLDQT
jgi:CheY-like chemotaxis protein